MPKKLSAFFSPRVPSNEYLEKPEKNYQIIQTFGCIKKLFAISYIQTYVLIPKYSQRKVKKIWKMKM